MKALRLVLAAGIVANALADVAIVRAKFIEAAPHLPVASVNESPMPDLYEVHVDGRSAVFHVSADGQFLLAGDLYTLGEAGMENLTEAKREVIRRDFLARANPDGMLVFAPDGTTRAVLTVFTDVTCPYCRRFHDDVAALNEMGIEVRYLAFPRGGIGSDSYKTMRSAWCSDDPKWAIDELKRGNLIPEATCGNPLAEHIQLGNRVGVEGTPTLITGTGKRLSGYMRPSELADQLGLTH